MDPHGRSSGPSPPERPYRHHGAGGGRGAGHPPPPQPPPRDDTSLSPSSPSPSIGSSSSAEGPDLHSPSSPPVQLHRGHPGGHHHGGGHAKGIDVPLLAGEKIEAVYADITFLCAYSLPTTVKGTMTVTNYKLYFRSGSQDNNPLILDVPLGFVSRVEKVGGQRSSGDSAYGLEIYCKDIRSLRFRLNKSDSQHSRKDIFEMVREFPRAKDRCQIQSHRLVISARCKRRGACSML